MEPGLGAVVLARGDSRPSYLLQTRSAAGKPRGPRTAEPAAQAAAEQRTQLRRRNRGGNALTSQASSCKSWRPRSKGTATRT